MYDYVKKAKVDGDGVIVVRIPAEDIQLFLNNGYEQALVEEYHEQLLESEDGEKLLEEEKAEKE